MISGASRFAHIQNQARANGQNVSELARLYTLEGMLPHGRSAEDGKDYAPSSPHSYDAPRWSFPGNQHDEAE